jgi:hypothetical protein
MLPHLFRTLGQYDYDQTSGTQDDDESGAAFLFDASLTMSDLSRSHPPLRLDASPPPTNDNLLLAPDNQHDDTDLEFKTQCVLDNYSVGIGFQTNFQSSVVC